MTDQNTDSEFLRHLGRIADALEKYSPTDPTAADIEPAEAYVWNHASRRLTAINKVNRVDLRLLCG
ncbi:MAG: AAA family ATPase, partial [Candidatus Puniceispirillaceae bacterium]